MAVKAIRRVGEIASFHVHVYFDPARERETALTLRDAIAERFLVQLGRVWDRPVGPHSRAMYQVAFAPDLFGTLVPWMMLNGGGLSILVHPNTTNPRRDHLDDPLWIGTPLPVSGDILPEIQDAEPAGAPNTRPDLEP
jgi:DOPA 4,5-dioxygenase